MKDLRVEFIEDGHRYLINGVEAHLSLTQLLRKHNLAPDYSKVNKEVLQKRAKIGTDKHKDLELVIKDEKYEPMTLAGQNYKEWFDKNVECGDSEVVLGIDYKGLLIGMQADALLLLNPDKEGVQYLCVDDHKFNAQLHKEYVRWQTSVIRFVLKYASLNGYKINDRSFEAMGQYPIKQNVDFFQTGDTTETLNRIELNPVSDSEIIALFEAELEGKIYEPKVAQVDLSNKAIDELVEAEIKLAEMELQTKALKKQIADNKKLVLETLQANNIKSWETPNKVVKYTYVEGSSKVELDLVKYKNENPSAYAKLLKKYNKLTTRSASIRTTVDTERYEEIKAINNEIKELREE